MVAYWIVFVIILFFCITDFFKIAVAEIYKKAILIFLLILLGLFAGLRYKCDNDYDEYIRIYNQVPTLREFFTGGYQLSDIYGEPLFVITNIVFKTIGAADYIYLTFISFLNLFFLYKSITAFSKYWFLSLFLYFSLMYLGGGFTQIRFGVATTLAWYGIVQYYQGKIKVSILAIFCALMFHVSALSILIVFMANRFFKTNTYTVLTISFLSVLITLFSFGGMLGSFITLFAGDSRYESYLDSEVYSEKANSIAIYFYCISILIFWFFRGQMIRELGEQRFYFLFKIGLVAVLFGALFNQMAILSRFGLILQFCYIFILPHTFGLKPVRLIMLLFLFMYGMFRYSQFLGEESFIQDYKTVITNK